MREERQATGISAHKTPHVHAPKAEKGTHANFSHAFCPKIA
jgi:hypothetical protein